MLRKVCSYILAASCVLAVAGCADDVAVNPEGVMLHLEIADVSAGVATRAVPAELPKPVQEQFRLAIVNEQGRTVYDDAFAPSVGPFAPGRFTLSVGYGEDVLALDAPCYAGEATASVYKGLQNNVRIDARVANALMSIAYQADGREALDEVFESYGVTFTLDGRTVSIEGSDPTASAYFPAGSVPAVTFHAVRRADGLAVSTSLDATLAARLPLEAGRHARVTLGVSQDRVQITKVDVEEVTISQTIPPSWLPRPKTSVSGFDAAGTLHNVETEEAGEAKVDFTTSSVLQDVELTLDIQDPAYSRLTGTHLLSAMSAEEIETLRTAGIELPAAGTEGGTINLTRFATNLQTDNGATTTNTLSLRVKANDRWDTESPQTYSIVVEKPVFGARVLPGNIWTREFTISPLRAEDVTKGNFDVLNQRIVYQLQQPDGSWKSYTSRDVKNLTPGTSYTIRAYLREGITSEPVTVNTFPLTALENGGFEDAYTSSGKDSGARYSGRVFTFPGWATLNELTVDVGSFPAFAFCYSSFSGTRPTGSHFDYLSLADDTHGGATALWLGTIAWGIGNTNAGGGSVIKNVSPGELFLGSLNNVNHSSDTADKNYGISYASHPTAITFWYKYKAYTEDHGIALIKLYSGDTLLGEGEFNCGDQAVWTQQTLEITYNQDESKLALMPNKLEVTFKSGTKTDKSGIILGNPHVGSQLMLDDIALVYDK